MRGLYCSGGRRGHRLLHLSHLLGGGKHILTVEGLQGKTGELTEIQKAFIEGGRRPVRLLHPGHHSLRCGDRGNRANVHTGGARKLISGHLCRCTGYQNILNAVEKAVNVCNGYVGREQS